MDIIENIIKSVDQKQGLISASREVALIYETQGYIARKLIEEGKTLNEIVKVIDLDKEDIKDLENNTEKMTYNYNYHEPLYSLVDNVLKSSINQSDQYLIKETQKQIAINLLSESITFDKISNITGLTKEEVKKLSNKHSKKRIKQMLKLVEKDLILSELHLKLAYKLLFHPNITKVKNTSLFWFLTAKSNKDIAIIKLSRVYDDDGDSITLQRIINIIKQDNKFWDISQSAKEELDKLVETDQDFIAKDENKKFKNEQLRKLFEERNQEVAHLDKKIIEELQDLSSQKLITQQLIELCQQGLDIIHRYKNILGFSVDPYNWDEKDWDKIIDKNLN